VCRGPAFASFLAGIQLEEEEEEKRRKEKIAES